MNLLLISNLFPTPSDPERGVFTLQLVKRLRKFCKVTVVCPLPWFPSRGPLAKLEAYREYSGIPPKYEIDGVEVYAPRYLLLPKVSSRLHANLMYLALRRLIPALHRKIGFDLINSHWLYPDGVAANRLARSLGIPHVPTGLGCDINRDLYDDRKRNQVIEVVETAAALIVVSRDLQHELEKNDVALPSTSVIANGVDFEKFGVLPRAQCRSQLGITATAPVYLFVGRLSEEKGLSSLLEAGARVAATGQDFELYLVGDGPQRDELQNLAAGLGIRDRVHFTGKVDHDEVGTWMGAADFFCLPSLREGCPNVMLEALGSGRPVLASRVGAIPDIVNKDTGILFTPTDVNSISQAMQEAIVRDWNPDTIHQSISGLSWEATAQKYFAVFQQSCTAMPHSAVQEL